MNISAKKADRYSKIRGDSIRWKCVSKHQKKTNNFICLPILERYSRNSGIPMIAYSMVATFPHWVRGARFPYPRDAFKVIYHLYIVFIYQKYGLLTDGCDNSQRVQKCPRKCPLFATFSALITSWPTAANCFHNGHLIVVQFFADSKRNVWIFMQDPNKILKFVLICENGLVEAI